MVEQQKKRFYLKKKNILRERKEFKHALTSGRKIENRYFQIIYAGNQQGNTRVAVVIGRKFGKANVRNKIRRRIKEAYRVNMERFPVGTDYIIRPREAVKYICFVELKDSFIHLVQKCSR